MPVAGTPGLKFLSVFVELMHLDLPAVTLNVQ